MLLPKACYKTLECFLLQNSHFLSAQECIMAADFQNKYTNPCKLSPDGHFGSKFVTVVVTGIFPYSYTVQVNLCCLIVVGTERVQNCTYGVMELIFKQSLLVWRIFMEWNSVIFKHSGILGWGKDCYFDLKYQRLMLL